MAGVEAFVRSGRAAGGPSLIDAAENLVGKAVLAWDEDRETARRLIQRASVLPFDSREEVVPVAAGADQVLFNLISDEAEVAEEGDSRWLDAVLTVIEDVPSAREDLLAVVTEIPKSFSLSRSERSSIRRAVGRFTPRSIAERGTSGEELVAEVQAVVEASRRYLDVLDELDPVLEPPGRRF